MRFGRERQRKASYADLARLAGVSATTVSFVLNNRTDVAISQATRDRVQAAAKELGYRPNRLAGSLVRGRSTSIGILVPEADSPFSASLTAGVLDVCEKHNHGLILAHTRHSSDVEAFQINMLLEHRVDGVIALVEPGNVASVANWLPEVDREEIPCVLIGDGPENRADVIRPDEAGGMRQAIEHLKKGNHTRIALITADDKGREPFMQAIKAAGLLADENVVSTSVESLLKLKQPPTGIVAVGDLVVETVATLRDRGISVPSDVSVVAFESGSLGEWLNLTSVGSDPKRLGAAAAERVFERLQNEDLEPKRIEEPMQFAERTSIGPPRGTVELR